MSEEKKGIKESKEVLVAVMSLGIDAVKALKDGADFGDLSIFLDNMEKIKVAFEGYSEIPGEMADLDKKEMVELFSLSAEMVFDILDALKEKEEVK